MQDRYKRGDGRSYDALYGTWSQMLDRCENPANVRYDCYGARGITVCTHWQIFTNFKEDMGPRPAPQMTLDRIDGNKGYSKENCKWSTKTEQSRNTSRNIYVDMLGERVLYTDALRRLKIFAAAIHYRMTNIKETRQQAIDHYIVRKAYKLEEQLKRDD